MSTPTVNHLAVVSIRTNRISETVDFYQNVIGLSGMANHGHQAAFGLGSGLFLVITESDAETDPTPKQPRYPLLAFAVPDLDQCITQLKKHNIDMPWGVEGNRQDRWVEFYDPGGNLIELAQFGK